MPKRESNWFRGILVSLSRCSRRCCCGLWPRATATSWRPHVKLLIQPGGGIAPLLKGINSAKRSVEIAIFRFNLAEIETALTHAAKRGVPVHALIAYTNRGGERNLRK